MVVAASGISAQLRRELDVNPSRAVTIPSIDSNRCAGDFASVFMIVASTIDGSIAIKSPDFARDMAASVGATGIAMFRHPDRDCIYDEAVESIRWAKYAGMPIMEQVGHYRAERELAAGADPQTGAPADQARARELVHELGCLALEENEAWLKSRRERPLTPVVG